MVCKKKNQRQVPTFGLALSNQLSEWVRHIPYSRWTSQLQGYYSSLPNYLELQKRYFKMESRAPYRKKRNTNQNSTNMTTHNNSNRHIREVQLNNADYITVKTSKLVQMENNLYVSHTNGPVKLKVNISADFNEIPEKYHEIFLNVMTSKYLGSVSFGENPFSECSPMKKRKWYEFWKEKYYI